MAEPLQDGNVEKGGAISFALSPMAARLLGKDGLLIRDSKRDWFSNDLQDLTQRLTALLDEGLSVPPSGSAHRILLPCRDAAHALCGLLAIQAVGAVAVPWSDTAAKPVDMMSELFAPSHALHIEGEPKLSMLPATGTQSTHDHVCDIILTTTGSTGSPKGVCLDLDQLLLNALAAGVVIGLDDTHKWVVNTDIALTSGLCHLLMAMLFGAPFIHTAAMDEQAKDAALVGRYGYGGTPVLLSNLADKSGKVDAPQIMFSSGDFLMPAVIDKIRSAFPDVRLHKFYGLTELAGRFCHMPSEDLAGSPDSVGWPLPGFSARVADENGLEISCGEVGHIQCRGPLRMKGYIFEGNRFQPMGRMDWFDTGDLGKLDPQGRLTLLGRANFAFKVGGEKVDVYTIEKALESVLGNSPYLVTPVPHAVLGTVPALFVEVGPDATPPQWAQVKKAALAELPTRFVPMFGFAMECLPRLPNGKLDRRKAAEKRDAASRLL